MNSPQDGRSTEERNKAVVLEAFDLLFNRRDYAKAEAFWSPNYIQHSAHIPPGREGLFGLVRSLPPELQHESREITASGDLVMLHGRFTGHGQPRPWVVVDICRVKDDVLVEHWDVIEDEVSKANSVSGRPMFGETFPD